MTLLKKLRPEELVVLSFGLILFVLRCSVGVCGIPVVQSLQVLLSFMLYLIPLFVVMFLLYLMVSLLDRSFEMITSGGVLSFVRDFSPLLLVFLLYSSLSLHEGADLIHMVNPRDYDGLLAEIDQVLFGMQLSEWFQQFISVRLTETMYLFYSLHFFLPVIAAMVFYWSGSRAAFRDFMVGLVLVNCIGYVIYFIVPALGPAYTFKYEVPLVGGQIEDLVQLTGGVLRSTHRSAFPSLHVGMSTVIFLFALRHSRRLFYVLVLPVIMLWVSTVYLRQHYVVDLFAGWVLALACFYVSPRVNAFWGRFSR